MENVWCSPRDEDSKGDGGGSRWRWTTAAKVIEWRTQEHLTKGEGRATGAFLFQSVLLCLVMALTRTNRLPRVQCDQCGDWTYWDSVRKTTRGLAARRIIAKGE